MLEFELPTIVFLFYIYIYKRVVGEKPSNFINWQNKEEKWKKRSTYTLKAAATFQEKMENNLINKFFLTRANKKIAITNTQLQLRNIICHTSIPVSLNQS